MKALIIGMKPPDDEEGMSYEKDDDKPMPTRAFEMATKAFIKYMGIPPGDVNLPKATMALKAAIKACLAQAEENYDEYEGNKKNEKEDDEY